MLLLQCKLKGKSAYNYTSWLLQKLATNPGLKLAVQLAVTMVICYPIIVWSMNSIGGKVLHNVPLSFSIGPPSISS